MALNEATSGTQQLESGLRAIFGAAESFGSVGLAPGDDPNEFRRMSAAMHAINCIAGLATLNDGHALDPRLADWLRGIVRTIGALVNVSLDNLAAGLLQVEPFKVPDVAGHGWADAVEMICALRDIAALGETFWGDNVELLEAEAVAS